MKHDEQYYLHTIKILSERIEFLESELDKIKDILYETRTIVDEEED